MLDYGGEGRPVLFVPSLVNGAHILDLTPGRGLLSWLRSTGHLPLLVDWGAQDGIERRYLLSDYICRLGSTLDTAKQLDGRHPALVGYCMGGNLALTLAVRRQRDITGLALLPTP